uniref:Nucleoprotein TPR n=1 Tax=Monopterus albus TaxID=43700 RepID=A0A3Q3IRH3_MONAL
MAAVLLQVLGRTELNKLPKGAQNKLEKFVTELQNANEQQYFDIEKRLAESQEQILSVTRDLQTHKEENKKLSELKHTHAHTHIHVTFIKMFLCFAQFEWKGHQKSFVLALISDVKRLNERLTETNKTKMELQLKLDDIQSSDASVQHREKRMEQEKELLEKKIEWLTAELKNKTDELLNTNREKGKEILELQGSLKNSNDTGISCVSLCCLHFSLQAKDEQSSMEEKYRNELNARVKLSSLHEVGIAARHQSYIDSLKRKVILLYNAYAECQMQLQLEKQETRRVSRVLDEIVQEVESKAPVLKRQREEYESMQRSMASLCNKLEQARTEIYSLQKEKEEAKQHCDALERDKLRAERQLDDTSAQVCALLVELEEARGNQVTKDDSSSADISSTSEVTGPQQLSFRSVEELQRQNQSLLGKLRELQEEKDRQQTQVTSARQSVTNKHQKSKSRSKSDHKEMKNEMLNETNDRLQRQLTEVRSSHAKLTSQLEFSNKRYEMLQETVLAYRREISALQDRNQKMAATAQRHEHIIHTISQDLRQSNEKLALSEVRLENLSKERDMLRQAESRLTQEKEAMLAEQRNQNLLLINLKSIQLTTERMETETRQRLNNKIEQLEAELASMKTRLDQEIAQRHALGRSMDAQLLEAKKQLETQNTLQKKTRELLQSSEQQVSQSSQLEQELAEVKGHLRTAEEQNSELAEQLKNANATVEQYRAVVLTLEDSLKKEKESRSPLEIRLKESEDVQQQLEKRILEAEKMKQQEQEERRKAVDALEKQMCELQRSLKTSQTEQQEALERAAATATLQQKATQDSLLQTKLAGEARAKYERELMLHAADVEAMQELKKRFQEETTQKRELEEQLSKNTSLLQEKTAAWNAVERQLKDLSLQSRRCEELGRQNTLLHQQMDELTIRTRQQPQQQLDLSFSEEGKTTEQILEILRFVRREKQIAVAQCEVLEGETLRYRQRVEHQDRELKELLEVLTAEREKMQAATKTLAQQEEQLKKMESISALQEANKMLKIDRDKLEQELQQAQAKVTKLQSDISPLHHSLSQLSEKNGSLQADKRILEEDFKRWKAKAQQLANQQKDSDVEERQKLTSEREAQQRRITQLAEETAKLKTELARSSASSNSAQGQLQGLRDSVARLTAERDTLKKDLETKIRDILEKSKTIAQVKKIGRRYKTQYEELKAQHDKLVAERTVKAGSEAHPSQELTKAQEELSKAREELKELKEEVQKKQEELSDSKNKEEQLKQLMADKEEKMRKAIMGAKTKINQLNKQLSQEIEEVKQSKEELEVRMNALKSQYEGRILRLDRELRELREMPAYTESREEPQDQSGAKVHSADQRQISLKSPAQDRGGSSVSEPPTANIRPTPSTPSPSSKPNPSPGSKATPRASIRPMVTPASVPIPTPTATVMPTTQTDSQEASVHSTSSSLVNAPTSITQPTSTQATAFVQPTQQQAANQDTGSSIEAERPSTSSSLIGAGEQGHISNPPQYFFDDDDRMVPSTPTLVVPHRTDGFAEAIHSPQVASLSTRFRFGPPEDLLPQSSASHSDLGQLASQGGLGIYESPLFLAANDEDGGGRSVPTTPLQVAAPVTVFTESLPSDSSDNMASQSVPMVTASTSMAAAADDGDEVFMEQEGEGPGMESSLESQAELESTGQQSEDASLPSTSQDPGNDEPLFMC